MTEIQIRLIDVADLYYSGYYYEGFDRLSRADSRLGEVALRTNVSLNIPATIKNALQDKNARHLLFAISIYSIRTDSVEYFICIDAHDSNKTAGISDHTEGYHRSLLKVVDRYYKVNFNEDFLKHSDLPLALQQKVRPIAQFAPIITSAILPFCKRIIFPLNPIRIKPGLSHSKPYSGFWQDVLQRIRRLRKLQSLDQLLKLRYEPKTIDIFFVTSYRPNPRHNAAMEFRHSLMELINKKPHLHCTIGFTSHADIPPQYRKMKQPRLSQADYLKAMSRAKIVIYTQGMDGCISSKFLLAMSAGCVMLGDPINNNTDMIAKYTHLKDQFGYSNPSTVVDSAIAILSENSSLERLSRLNLELFDNYLSPTKAAQWILKDLGLAA
ncbi:hypothetical protein [Halioxenophilus aromaticivorans]|uniref:Glycosyl transferase family 1 domain-containing protein n=1 Tax=Halioxenophilus aromaticivorans TaxID=1306992 RepID=A0AAV3U568_9ALTE